MDPWALSALDGFYRAHARIYDWTRPFILFGRHQAIRALSLRPGERVLDVGCGTGWSLPRLCALGAARRKDVSLLNGHFLVTPDTADVVEVSGTMAEAPSFWIPRVDITKQYARVRGHRVNVRVDSVSHVRLLGESRFTMTTKYESIDGDTVLSLGAVAAREP